MSELRCPECGASGAQCEDTPKVHRHICPTCGYETVFRGRSPDCVLPEGSMLTCSVHDRAVPDEVALIESLHDEDRQ